MLYVLLSAPSVLLCVSGAVCCGMFISEYNLICCVAQSILTLISATRSFKLGVAYA